MPHRPAEYLMLLNKLSDTLGDLVLARLLGVPVSLVDSYVRSGELAAHSAGLALIPDEIEPQLLHALRVLEARMDELFPG